MLSGKALRLSAGLKEKTSLMGDLSMDKKKNALESVEDTMACSAFAEAGEPCPINTGKEASTSTQTTAKEEESILESVEEAMACSAFAEKGEPCPEENIEDGLSSASHSTAEKESILEEVENTLASSAFAEEDEPSPKNIGEHSK
jgi:hypothetical protein